MIFLSLLLAAINQSFSLLDPLIFGKIINFCSGLQKSETPVTETVLHSRLIPLVLMAMGVAMVSRIAKNFQDYFTNVVIQKTGVDMYKDGLSHSLELPFQEFEDQRSGETLEILKKVRTDSERFITSFINVIFQTAVGVVFVIIFTVQMNASLAGFMLLSVPFLGMLISVLSKKIKRMTMAILGETTSLSGSTTESLRNIELIKSLGLTGQEILRLNSITTRILKLELKKVRYIRSLSFVQGTVINFLRNCLLYFLCWLVFKNEIVIGDLITMVFYSFFIFGPLQEVGNVIVVWRETEASLQNFNKILSKEKEPRPQSPVKLGVVETLQFENVGFQHLTAMSKAVENISFTIKAGETIAFVGPSGSGKTTLVKLLVGLYKPGAGKILYNGINENEIEITELRQQLGFVTQDIQLFAGTIKENLLFVKPGASDEECAAAMQKASCQNLMLRAEKGLDTMIGEGGMKLSGGEKQRLAIARSLLRDPKLIVFDEATSALDSLTEEEITNTIKEISRGKERITIMIAHRLSTIMHADRIFVLEKGKIVESGKHNDLVEQKGLYYAMWRQQIGERKTEVAA
jgi:ATP-binding cassette, subfamily B, bacterial